VQKSHFKPPFDFARAYLLAKSGQPVGKADPGTIQVQFLEMQEGFYFNPFCLKPNHFPSLPII